MDRQAAPGEPGGRDGPHPHPDPDPPGPDDGCCGPCGCLDAWYI